MTDLFAIMSKLVDVKGKILIPGIYDQVRELTGKVLEKVDRIVRAK